MSEVAAGSEQFRSVPARWTNARVLIAAASVATLWFACHPYFGIVHDARIYVGRALADQDPAGVGRQLDFLYDGQSQFSAFRVVMYWAVHGLGPAAAAKGLTALGLALWIGAAAFFLSRFFRGWCLWASMLCVAVLPAGYGGFGVFNWGEVFATPRLFAEAAGLAALAFWIDGRRWPGAALLGISGFMHPLMAAPTVGAALLLECIRDRRWLIALVAIPVLGLGASFAGISLFARLLQPIDGIWMDVIVSRSPYLFPARWRADDFAPLACQLASLWLVWSVSAPTLRKVVVVFGVVAVAGLLIAAFVPTLLIAQLQLWRAQWLISFLAAGTFAPLAIELWRRGGAMRAALAMLVFAWVSRDVLAATAFGGIAAIALRYAALPPRLERTIVLTGWGLAVVASIGVAAIRLVARLHTLLISQGGVLLTLGTANSFGLQSVLVPTLAVILALAAPTLKTWRAKALASVGVIVAAVGVAFLWDARPEFTRAREDASGTFPSVAGTGAVQWLDSPGVSWLWTRRPEWWAEAQGAGVVFDRNLALTWSRRFDTLRAAGLVDPTDRNYLPVRTKGRVLSVVTKSGLNILCRAPDGPAFVVAPTMRVANDALPGATAFWHAPAVDYRPRIVGRDWVPVRDYAIFTCASLRGGLGS